MGTITRLSNKVFYTIVICQLLFGAFCTVAIVMAGTASIPLVDAMLDFVKEIAGWFS